MFSIAIEFIMFEVTERIPIVVEWRKYLGIKNDQFNCVAKS